MSIAVPAWAVPGSMSRVDNSTRDRTKALYLVGSKKGKNKGQKEDNGEFC